MDNEFFEVRKKKLEKYTAIKKQTYANRFDKQHNCAHLTQLADGTEHVSTAGRIMSMRNMGKLTFIHIQDHTAKFQCSLNRGVLGDADYDLLIDTLDIGDFIGVEGEIFTTQRGEKTLRAHTCQLLSKALRPLPEKWHGLTDPELKVRQRYLDLLTNEETRKRFEVRQQVIRYLRTYLEKHDFLEVETPILQSTASGASARPFITHHRALDLPLYLRIAHETYLKRLTVGGYERIFEIGKCFRNEGVDPSHLQEFTMLEYYVAYWDYRDNMRFIQSLLQNLLVEVLGTSTIHYQGKAIDFAGEWPEITFRHLLLQDTGIDIDHYRDLTSLKKGIQQQGLALDLDHYISYGSLLDGLYKKYARPKLVQPIFVTHQPKELAPLARSSDEEASKLNMFQLVVNSWEIVKAYSELVDPVEQRELLLEQARLAEAGDEEAMMLDEDFILSMEYGMPIMSGLGLGIDRLLTLLTDAKSIRDVVYFPSLRPMERHEVDGKIVKEEKR
jgi:lysyl-tRNA synthetase, class II